MIDFHPLEVVDRGLQNNVSLFLERMVVGYKTLLVWISETGSFKHVKIVIITTAQVWYSTP